MTAWQLASIPFWVSGYFLCGVGLLMLLGAGRKPHETGSDLIGQCGLAILFGMPFLFVAAWMWH